MKKLKEDLVVSRIMIVRGEKILLDRDLAALYGIETRVLKQAVKRNIKRFPNDFMFTLNRGEYKSLRSQIVTLEIPTLSKTIRIKSLLESVQYFV